MPPQSLYQQEVPTWMEGEHSAMPLQMFKLLKVEIEVNEATLRQDRDTKEDVFTITITEEENEQTLFYSVIGAEEFLKMRKE
mmetsp:Transcript_44904/g.43479  ORF Transcript_44904/g.43479 Transcript_44904/m.43479 type:complete len:82 (+) Transcript_44904:408-653(+)